MPDTLYQTVDLHDDTLGIILEKLVNNQDYLKEASAENGVPQEVNDKLEEINKKLDQILESGSSGGGVTGTGCVCCPYYKKDNEDPTD